MLLVLTRLNCNVYYNPYTLSYHLTMRSQNEKYCFFPLSWESVLGTLDIISLNNDPQAELPF